MLRRALLLVALAASLSIPSAAFAQGAYGPGACGLETTRVALCTGGPAGPMSLEEIDGNPVDAGAGAVGLGTLRFTLGTDDATALAIAAMAAWDLGAGITAATTQRVTVATDDPVSASLVTIAGWTLGGGLVDATTQRTYEADDSLLSAGVQALAEAIGAPAGPQPPSVMLLGAYDGIATRALVADTAGALTVSAAQLPPALGAQDQADSLSVVPSSGSVWTADTELPAAAALSDAIANPTAPIVGSAILVWDGAQWQRGPGTVARGSYVDLYGVAGSAVTANRGEAGSGTQRVAEASCDSTAEYTGTVTQGGADATIAARSGRCWVICQVQDADGALRMALDTSTNSCADGALLNAASAAGQGGGSFQADRYSGGVALCAPDAGTTISYHCVEVY